MLSETPFVQWIFQCFQGTSPPGICVFGLFVLTPESLPSNQLKSQLLVVFCIAFDAFVLLERCFGELKANTLKSQILVVICEEITSKSYLKQRGSQTVV